MALIVRPIDQLDVNSVIFNAPKVNDFGGKAIYLNLPGKQKMIFQLPSMRNPFGLSNFVDKASGKASYSLSVSLDSNPEIADQFKALDERVLDFVEANSTTLFGKKVNKATIRDVMYTSPIRRDKEGKYPETLYTKVMQTRDGKSFAVEAYESNRKPADLSTLEKGRSVMTIIEINQVWVIGMKCGVSVRLQQILFAPKTQLKGFSFVGVEEAPAAAAEDEDEEEAEIDAPEDEEYEEEEADV
jgi:hypothetical protein